MIYFVCPSFVFSLNTKYRSLLKISFVPKKPMPIFTLSGAKSESTCKSKVYFVLNGDKNETDVRQFPNGADDYFERGGIDSFVMTVVR